MTTAARQLPSLRRVLSANQVHVWRADLNLGAAELRDHVQNLSLDERDRADRFHFQQDRDRFIASHGLLRNVLSRYLDVAPGEVMYARNPDGKPHLSGFSHRLDLRFNLAHSHDIALFAVALGREVGVDVEREREDIDILEIAERFFSPAELLALQETPAGTRRKAFFRTWTRKEALLKATGKGLSGDLGTEANCSTPPASASFTIVSADGQPTLWTLHDISIGSIYSAALAVEGAGWQLFSHVA